MVLKDPASLVDKMQPYIDSLKEKKDFLSGDYTLLPEPLLTAAQDMKKMQDSTPPRLPWNREKWNQAVYESERDFEVAMLDVQLVLENHMNLHAPELSCIPVASERDTLYGPRHQEMASYLSSLKDPANIFSGEKELLPDKLGELYGNLISLRDYALEDHYSPLVASDDKKASALAYQEATRQFREKMNDMQTELRKERETAPYARYNLPEEANVSDIHLRKNYNGGWSILAEMDGYPLAEKTLSLQDEQSYFKFKTATLEQLAGKHYRQEISDKLDCKNAIALPVEKVTSLKI